MSDDNGNNGDDNTPDNVIPFPSRPKHISDLLPDLIEDLTGKLTSEQLRDFETFIKAKHPLPEDAFTNIDQNASFTIKLDEHGDIVDSFTPEELEERIFKAETLVDKSFEYIKVIERTMFKYENSLQINELQWLSTELQKIFIELQKKVDFEE